MGKGPEEEAAGSAGCSGWEAREVGKGVVEHRGAESRKRAFLEAGRPQCTPPQSP